MNNAIASLELTLHTAYRPTRITIIYTLATLIALYRIATSPAAVEFYRNAARFTIKTCVRVYLAGRTFSLYVDEFVQSSQDDEEPTDETTVACPLNLSAVFAIVDSFTTFKRYAPTPRHQEFVWDCLTMRQ